MTAGRPAGPSDSPGFLLWRSTLRWQRAIAAALRPLALTHVQFVLLAGVCWLPEQDDGRRSAPSQRQVAALTGVDVMMTSQVVRALEHRGLLERTADPADARVKRITVTDAGRTLQERAIEVVHAVDADFFGSLSDAGPLLRVLRQLAGPVP